MSVDVKKLKEELQRRGLDTGYCEDTQDNEGLEDPKEQQQEAAEDDGKGDGDADPDDKSDGEGEGYPPLEEDEGRDSGGYYEDEEAEGEPSESPQASDAGHSMPDFTADVDIPKSDMTSEEDTKPVPVPEANTENKPDAAAQTEQVKVEAEKGRNHSRKRLFEDNTSYSYNEHREEKRSRTPQPPAEDEEENIDDTLVTTDTWQGTLEQIPDSDADSESGPESFFTDEEVDYMERTDPAEDRNPAERPTPLSSPIQPSSALSSPTTFSERPFPSHLSPSSPSTSVLASPKTITLRGQKISKGRSRGRSRSRSRQRSRSPSCPGSAVKHTRWNSAQKPDTYPKPRKFTPKRKPGHQLDSSGTYTPLDLFSLFLDRSAVTTLCTNINKQAAKNIAKGKKYAWTTLEESEFYRFIGLVFYFSLVKLSAIADYWRKDSIFSQSFPPKVMARDRYRTIFWNIHMSDPDQDVENDRMKGTPQHDKLFCLRPLIDTLRMACKTHYHPRRNIAIDERMVATKAHTGMTQYMKAKPTKWGFKLFVLADSSNGYTVDFSVYTGKSQFSSGKGLAYDSVMSLINHSFLGSGYHLYVDNFYTSPKLFMDLYAENMGACGTYRENRENCPRAQSNALSTKDPRGTIRWIRDGPLLFVKWMDLREVSICSTIHLAYTGETVKRRVKDADGTWTTQHVPCPNPVIEYNKYMGGVDLSDQLIQYYSVKHTTMCWYRTLFYHFLDIAATNAYVIHKELCKEKGQTAMTHRGFLEELTAQLCGVTVTVPPAKASEQHLPVAISKQAETSKRASYGRRSCVHCRNTTQKKQATPWKCQVCDVALCLIADRNCFQEWHQLQ